jgi:CelD/BcsL family acetyltransferase involved in cellulose biosynthesis
MDGVRVESVPLERLGAVEDVWRALSRRALEPNVFAEPAFVVNALRHLAPEAQCRPVLVWRGAADDRLIGALVLETPLALPGLRVARIWRSEQAGLAALLLDQDEAAEALAALLDWLARARPAVAGLLAPALAEAGPTKGALAALARRQNLRRLDLGRAERALLLAPAAPDGGFEDRLPKKRSKEWARLLRRLGERGAVAFRVAADAESIEAFLSIEARGWKGARRTALGSDPGRAAFTRAMLAAMARDGALAVHVLAVGGAAIAAAVVLRSGERAFYWKTAYDEAYAEYSPGVQVTLALSRAQMRDPSLAATDSCAIAGHPMIDRLWPARLALVDQAIATRSGPAIGLALWGASEQVRRRIKETAKRLINPLRGRKRS